MSKNAYVLVDHFGDDGRAREGRILTDLSDQRFAALEKKGLIREATAAEVKAGSQIAFDKDTSGEPAGDSDTKQKDAPKNKAAPAADNKAG